MTLSLLCLDQWKFSLHSGPKEYTNIGTASHHDYGHLHIGTVPSKRYSEFLEEAGSILKTVQKRKGSGRSAAFNEQGHQKTPAMIQAVLSQALHHLSNANESMKSPLGGFTDVGAHTGGSERNTAWPLLQIVLQHVLELLGSPQLSRKITAQLYLALAESGVSNIREQNQSFKTVSREKYRGQVNSIMQTIRYAQKEILDLLNLNELSDHSYLFANRCVLIRHILTTETTYRSELLGKQFELFPSKETDQCERDFIIPITLRKGVTKRMTDMSEIHKKALLNINYVLSAKDLGQDWFLLYKWIGKQQKNAFIEKIFFCRTVEAFMFNAFNGEMTQDESVISIIDKIVDIYQNVVSSTLKDSTVSALMQVELRSREVLVLWIAFCICHSLVSYREPLVLNYSPALIPQDLKHLVLSEKLSKDALFKVAKYLHQHNQHGAFLFSLRPGDGTIDFAKEYAEQSVQIQSKWDTERDAAEKRKNVRWEKIQKQKEKLDLLDHELQNLKNERQIWLNRFDMTEEVRYGPFATTSKNDKDRQIATARLKDFKLDIKIKMSEISNMERPPTGIMQPLPSSPSKALPILFFLSMPESLEILSRLSFTAQCVLLPRDAESGNFLNPGDLEKGNFRYSRTSKSLWYEYYGKTCTGRSFPAARTRVTLGSNECIGPGNSWYPNNVRMHFSADTGVWHPDSISIHLLWKDPWSSDSSHHFLDPFKTMHSEGDFVRAFTEVIKNEDIEWSSPQYGSCVAPERGNEGLSRLFNIPLEYSGDQYLHITGLRAYPHLQFRNVCTLLKQRKIPLGDYHTQDLVRQALFHIGDLSIDEKIGEQWHMDTSTFDGWICLRETLQLLCDELRFKTREHESFQFLGELAAYASQWDFKTSIVAREFAKVARGWADDLSKQEILCKPEELDEIRLRRCLFYLYALLCFGENISSTDTQFICDLIVMSYYYGLFKDKSSDSHAVDIFFTRAKWITSKWLDQLLDFITEDSTVLTNAMNLIVDRKRESLFWERCYEDNSTISTNCFTAVSDDGHHFCLNLLTGSFLLDGEPPSRLSENFLSNPMYRKVFGSRNFEVVRGEADLLSTTRPILDRFYEFGKAHGRSGILIREIEESKEHGTLHLELLDPDSESSKWASDMYVRTRNMYSHWICHEKGVILCRPLLFSERQVSYFLKHDSETGKASRKWICYRIPEHLRGIHWVELDNENRCHSLDRLMRSEKPETENILRILSKFETVQDCIEIYSLASKSISFELPRFGIDFQLSSDGFLESRSYKNFRLCQHQQISQSLPDFYSYLLLENGKRRKLLIPSGTVSRNEETVIVHGSEREEEQRCFFVYDLHSRFRTFETDGGSFAIEARLQLAAIYTLTGSLLPEQMSHKTGCETAMDLLRQSWNSKPFSDRELMHLKTITDFGNMQPSLGLLCMELRSSANDLFFLHMKQENSFSVNVQTFTCYLQQKREGETNLRNNLTADEELQVLGHTLTSSYNKKGSYPKFDWFPLKQHVSPVRLFNDDLRNLVECCTSDFTHEKLYPFSASGVESTMLGMELMSDLRESWKINNQLPIHCMVLGFEEILLVLSRVLVSCSQELKAQQNRLLKSLLHVPSLGFHSMKFIMSRASNEIPTLSIRDLAMVARSPRLIESFNPFLSADAKGRIKDSVLQWLTLCVLEDKVIRMKEIAETQNMPELLRELKELDREWDYKEHPHWLLFEVEQQLQIRKLQYLVARFCIRNEKTITQLNMGEGKTRVILPMLTRELANSEHLLRVHFLSPLLIEAYHFLHRTLTASLFPQRICVLPFNRDISMDVDRAIAMKTALNRIRESGGIVCVAPEHRLSLELKWHETRLKDMHGSTYLRQELDAIRRMRYYDILDESDELLSFKYQLIYAEGSCARLPAGKERWVAIQAALHVLQFNDEVSLIFQKIGKSSSDNRRRAGTFREIRLLMGEEMNQFQNQFLQAVASGILRNPPYHLRHLRDLPHRQALISFLTDKTKDMQWLRSHFGMDDIPFDEGNMLLTIRGLLAYGMLEHCMSRRYRVDYGINDRRGKKRRVAVPYRASDTPSDRSEYAQPDILIIFTHLSYYYRGLTKELIKEATKSLLALGPIEQRSEYMIWLDLARDTMSAKELEALDNVVKIDTTCDTQVNMMYDVFRFNIAAINFWLGMCVLPRETMQFPQRLTANAFNLTDNPNGHIAGFSGTKDNRMLLPLQVQQKMPDSDEIRATDGKMLRTLLQNDVVITLTGNEELNIQVIKTALGKGANALIDAGACMAGMSNDAVVKKVIDILKEKDIEKSYEGVVYFSQSDSTWKVCSLDGRRWHYGNSPIHERDAFVYFDESRCRGADMKLKDDAVGLVTIGPSMCKDKIMQAAGRMRKLDRGQKLMFAVPSELVANIRTEDKPLRSRDLLRWVFCNSVDAIVDGMPEWAAQGFHFCTTREPEARVLEEKLAVDQLYAGALVETSVAEHISQLWRASEARIEGIGIKLTDADAKISDELVRRSVNFGQDWCRTGSAIGEECEREVENERELVHEKEVQIPKCAPFAEVDWNADSLLSACGVNDVDYQAGVMHLQESMQQFFKKSKLHLINWEICKLYVTKNFIQTVTDDHGNVLPDLSYFMRPVNMAVVFCSEGSVLLLSEREADRVLKMGWHLDDSQRSSVGWVLVNSCFLLTGDVCEVQNWNLRIPQGGQFEKGVKCNVSHVSLAGLQLFSGETMFGSDERCNAVAKMLHSDLAKIAVKNLLEYRWKQNMMARSDLEEICSRREQNC